MFNHLQSSSACNWIPGFRSARSAPSSAEKSKPAQANLVPFEVKMNDFPELAGVSLAKAGPPFVQRVCWGPSPQSTSPLTQTSAFTWKVSLLQYQMSSCAVCGKSFSRIWWYYVDYWIVWQERIPNTAWPPTKIPSTAWPSTKHC